LELNYSSDIDLIGLYESEGEIGEITRHEFHTKLFTEIGKELQHYDENGFLYRVDWDLRPEGKTGTLANSLAAMETYYETFGEDWERQAFIKADVLYQRDSIGERFLAMMTPFAYRKYIDVKTFERLRDMKSRITIELGKKKSDGINIKIGHGGIRDVEFIVQGLQLLNGGKVPALRARGTIDALELLKAHNLIEEQTAALLRQGYLFLRRIESALQMEDERQTHLLKNSPNERLKITRRLGYTEPNEQALSTFSEEFQKTSDFIHKTFQSFYE
jgi:glutamate-ammonia-ligase adenylyltransferase